MTDVRFKKESRILGPLLVYNKEKKKKKLKI